MHNTATVMKTTLLCAILALSAGLTSLPGQEWESLFNGENLEGWKAGENPFSFRVVEGQIACDGPRAHLFYAGGDAEFKNFELSVDVLTEEGANSGVYFHTEFQKEDWPRKGFEVQIINERNGQGDYRENKLTGSLYGIRNVYKTVGRDNEWFNLRVLVRGKNIQVRVNELLLVDYTEPAEPPETPYRGRRIGSGTFALQCHDEGSKVYFKNIRVRRLPHSVPGNEAPAKPFSKYEKEVIRLGAANYPMVNYHVHLKGGLTLEQALEESRRTGVFYGIAVNCGLNFPVTNDAGIFSYLETMRGKPVFVAMQAEGREWLRMFSPEAIARFDYVFTDAMTIFDNDGRRMRLWIKEEVPQITDKQAFMEMLVDRTVRILSTEPIDVYVNPTYLPAQIAEEYDELWTEPRMKRVVRAAAKHGRAIEINAKAKLPSRAFLKFAKAAGCKFTFGTNNTDEDIGQLDYCFQMIRELDLKWQDIWVPGQYPDPGQAETDGDK